MKNREIQIAMAAAGFYRGGIDGDLGPKSVAARDAILKTTPVNTARWSKKRKWVAAVQSALRDLKYDPGIVDGYYGHNTREALNTLLHKLATGRQEVVEREPVGIVGSSDKIPHQRDRHKFYGDPETEVPNRLVIVELPFYLRIDWNLRQKTNRITVHQLCGPSIEAAVTETYRFYGEDEWRRLGLDRYAGGYNKRKMRGSNSWSTHASGCAVDFYAQPNGLRTRCPDALFCRPEYKNFLDIMQDHEWFPAIRLWGADAMHFQRATL